MATYIKRNIRAASTAKVWGVGTTSYPYVVNKSASEDLLQFRMKSLAASGYDTRVINARLYWYGAAGGDVIRAYAIAAYNGVAAGGTMTGIHATASINASCAISGQAAAGRFTLEAAAAQRTLGGTISGLIVDSNIGASNTMPTNHSFIRFANVGSVALSNLLQLPAAPVVDTLFSAHAGYQSGATTGAVATHSIKFIDSAGTAYYLLATTSTTTRTS